MNRAHGKRQENKRWQPRPHHSTPGCCATIQVSFPCTSLPACMKKLHKGPSSPPYLTILLDHPPVLSPSVPCLFKDLQPSVHLCPTHLCIIHLFDCHPIHPIIPENKKVQFAATFGPTQANCRSLHKCARAGAGLIAAAVAVVLHHTSWLIGRP